MKIFSLFNKFSRNNRGDTIVEVLISMTILVLVMGTAYLMSSHSLQTSTAAGQRNLALGYAQSQIEFIKETAANNTFNTNSMELDNYTDGTYPNEDFCFTPDGSLIPIPRHDRGTNDCLTYDYKNNNQLFSVRVSYNDKTKIFLINVWWAGANLTAEQSHLVLYYKLPGDFASSKAKKIKVQLRADPASVARGGSSTLTWDVNNTTLATRCTFSSNWPIPKPSSTTFNGSQRTGPLLVSQTYTLTCTDPVNGNDSDSAEVDVRGGPPPITCDTDGIDNDNDGTIDEPGEPCQPPLQGGCDSDGIDNDNDGTIDEPGEPCSGGGGGGGGCLASGGRDPAPGNTLPNPCIRAFSVSGSGSSLTFNWDMDHCWSSNRITYPGGTTNTSWVDDSNESGTTSVGNADPAGGTARLWCDGGDAGMSYYNIDVEGNRCTPWPECDTEPPPPVFTKILCKYFDGGESYDQTLCNPPFAEGQNAAACVYEPFNDPPAIKHWGPCLDGETG